MEQKKKKKRKIWIIIGIIVVLFVGCTAALGSEDSESTEEVTKTESAKEEKVEKEAEEVKEEPKEVVEENQDAEEKEIVEMDTSDVAKVDNMGRAYFQIGETKECSVTNITLLDLQIVTQDTGMDYVNDTFGSTFACAVVELESHYNEVYNLWQDVMLYVDDYQYDATGYNVTDIVVDGVSLGDMPSELSPGRKCKYVYYASLPDDAFTAEKVEMTIANDSIPILLKKDYVWTVTTDGPVKDADDYFYQDGVMNTGVEYIDTRQDNRVPAGLYGYVDEYWRLHSNKPVVGPVDGEYYYVGKTDSGIITVSDGMISMTNSSDSDFESISLDSIGEFDTEFGTCCAYDVDFGAYTVTFFEGGLFIHMGHDSYATGFYTMEGY